MRPTYNAIWLVADEDAELVAAALGSSGSPEDNARTAAALVRARPDALAAVELAVQGKDPVEAVRIAASVAAVDANDLVEQGRAAARALGLELSSVSSSKTLRAEHEARGGKVPGLLVQTFERVVVEVEPVDDLAERVAALERLVVGKKT